ncbi:MAG: hypothetical protein ACOC5M_01595 [Chloroflexota bacterium]
MNAQQQRTIREVLREFLRHRGEDGATLEELYEAVWSGIGEEVARPAIRRIIYTSLQEAKEPYSLQLERVGHRLLRYRLKDYGKAAE